MFCRVLAKQKLPLQNRIESKPTMLGKQENGIDLTCTEQSIPEFPNLLFGTEIESSNAYFDATIYLQKQAPEKNINSFFSEYKKPIESLCEAYDVAYKDFCKINKKGHYLIKSDFTYLFIAFADPNFMGYMCDRINELFVKGVVVSDTYLISTARERLTPEILQTTSQQ